MKVLYIMVVITVAILAMMSSPVEGCKQILYVVICLYMSHEILNHHQGKNSFNSFYPDDGRFNI